MMRGSSGAGSELACADGPCRRSSRVCPGRGTTSSTPLPVGPDGKLYLSQGAMTNTGVIGLDAYELGWLRRLPHAHDVPSYDIVLGESNVETPDPLAGSEDAR